MKVMALSPYSGPEEAGSLIIPSAGKADIVIRPHLFAVANDAVYKPVSLAQYSGVR